MRLLDDFSASYAEADAGFVELAQAQGAALTSYEQPGRGPQGETLVTRVASFGAPKASRLLFVQSGTHGVEGFCGSGGQLGWMREGSSALPADTAVVLIHGINPHGFAWGRRETQEGVDLNRNFVDHDQARPSNPGYAQLHSSFLPAELSGPQREQADLQLAAFREQQGEAAFQAALAKGQYSHPGGLYYGGSDPTWSNQTLRQILATHAKPAKRVGFIDLHSGLGPFGYGMLITLAAAGSNELERIRRVHGDSVVAPFDDPDSLIPEVRGHALGACVEELSHAEVTAVALEFGTYSIDNDMNTYRAMLWLGAHGERDSKLGQRIRADFRRHFYPESADWKEMVWQRTQQVIRQGLAGLT